MFKWFKKKKEETQKTLHPAPEIQDSMEESLWEIKEEYDLPTEEIINVVYSKRRNIDHMHQMLSKKEKYE